MSTVEERAADIERELRAAISDGWRTTLLFDAANVIAGLLADPTTSRTDTEQAVIDAAIAKPLCSQADDWVEGLRATVHANRGAELVYVTPQHLGRIADFIERMSNTLAEVAIVAAVDRLTATEETT